MSIVIYENKAAFQDAIVQSKSKRKIYSELLTEVNKYIQLDEKNRTEVKEFKENPFLFFQGAFMKKHKEKNTFDLSFDKLTMLLDVNVTGISILSDKYLKYKEVSEDPKEHEFVELATTRDQIERYTDAKKICNLIMDTKLKYNPYLNLTGMVAAYNPMLIVDYSSFTVQPNPYWVINGNQ